MTSSPTNRSDPEPDRIKSFLVANPHHLETVFEELLAEQHIGELLKRRPDLLETIILNYADLSIIDKWKSANPRNRASNSKPILPSHDSSGDVREYVRRFESLQALSTSLPPMNPRDSTLSSAERVPSPQSTQSLVKLTKSNSEILLRLASSISHQTCRESVAKKIISSARRLLLADRCSLFLVDHDRKELYSTLGDSDSDSDSEEEKEMDPRQTKFHKNTDEVVLERQESSSSLQLISPPALSYSSPPVEVAEISKKEKKTIGKEVRFDMHRGIAGYVATTGRAVNIENAYESPWFNRSVDMETGYRTRSLLCLPISYGRRVLGVAQLVNKLSVPSIFTADDEKLFSQFAVFCGIALHKAIILERLVNEQQKHNLLLEMLSYHSQATDEELNEFLELPVPEAHEFLGGLSSFAFDPHELPNEASVVFATLRMFLDLGLVKRFSIPYETLCRFILTVRRNYRRVPYHNFQHAVTVAHFIYALAQNCGLCSYVNDYQLAGLFVGALCHDLDHRGTNNDYQRAARTPLAALYSTAILEHHHLQFAAFILTTPGHNIFAQLPRTEYRQVLEIIEQAILATDLASHFNNLPRMREIFKPDSVMDDSPEAARLLRSLVMTCSDLSNLIKPWPLSLKLAVMVCDEFCSQGDKEKMMGRVPMDLMDREKMDQMPRLQVGFIDHVSKPALRLLVQIFPLSAPLLEVLEENRSHWVEYHAQQYPDHPPIG